MMGGYSSSVRLLRSATMKPSSDPGPVRDHTSDLPDECLALIFQSLGSGDRKRCSLVCRRWLVVDGQSRHRLSLDARADLIDAAPSIFARFDAVTKLALKCDRRSDSISDDALALISGRCPNLIRLKLRSCRLLTESGMSALAKHCPSLRKLSCGSCTFGARGIDALLRGCPSLEDLSIKRLRGLSDLFAPEPVTVSASSLRSVCLKEMYNGQCFVPLIARAGGLRTLKLIRCSGDWDLLLEDIASATAPAAPAIAEIHLEKLQVSDRGLCALAACVNLETLHLVKTPECTDVGLLAVAEKCRLLRKVHIDGWKANRIGGDLGLMALAGGCRNLQELVLIGVKPTALSLTLVADNCSNLERLALCGSETFGDAEMCCIAAKCLSLKKLCIKGCPVSDMGMEVLAEGCPNLVKLKVKKCRGVTPQGADRLRGRRPSLAVNLDDIRQIEQVEDDVEVDDEQRLGSVVDQMSAGMDLNLASTSTGGRSSQWKTRVGFLAGRNFLASTLRRWSHGNGNSDPDHHHES